MNEQDSSLSLKAIGYAVLIGLSGCSTPNPPLQILPLDFTNSESEGSKAISLNGYVTPVFSAKVTVDATGKRQQPFYINCPAPPVDAIATVNRSLGITDRIKAVFSPGGQPVSNDLQAAITNAAAAASIGLRTNSTTLLSYNLAANCLAYMGGATENAGYMELARRNQYFTFGILAIDSLANGPKAQQGALGGSADAATGTADLTKQNQAVNDAQASLEAAQKARDAEIDVVNTKQADANQATADLNQANKQLATAKAGGDKAAIDAANQDVATKTSAAQTKGDSLRQENTKLAGMITDVRVGEGNLARAQAALDFAQGAVRAGSTATAFLGAEFAPTNTPDQVAKSAAEIVRTISVITMTSEMCSSILHRFNSMSDADVKIVFVHGSLLGSLLDKCTSDSTTQTKTLVDALKMR